MFVFCRYMFEGALSVRAITSWDCQAACDSCWPPSLLMMPLLTKPGPACVYRPVPQDNMNDVLLVMYLSDLIRSHIALADKLGTMQLPLI